MKLIQPIIVNFKLVDKVYFQLRSVHNNQQNHLDWISEVMEGD